MHVKQLRAELLSVKADLERELELVEEQDAVVGERSRMYLDRRSNYV